MNKSRFWWSLYIPMLVILIVLALPFTRAIFVGIGARWLYMLFIAFSMTFCLTPVFSLLARRFGILDQPDDRKLHVDATPLLGGGAVFFGLIAAISANGICSPTICKILVATALLFIVGVIDDIWEISATLKLVAQLAATVLVMSAGVILDVVPVQWGWIAVCGNVMLTLTWIIGIMNAMNFFDGMDGLAAGLGAMISFFLGFIALQTYQPFLGWVAVAMMGSCLGFLPYNLKGKGRASIFLGDAGSTVIGFVLACIAVYGEWSPNSPVVALISPLLIFWVLIFDMVYITVDRIVSGKVSSVRQWLEYVGKDHLHHRLAAVIGSNKKSVMFIYLLSFSLGIGALLLRNAGPIDALLLVVQACILVGLISVLEWHGRLGANGNGGRRFC